MPENNRFQYSNFRQVFGELESVYCVRRGFFEKIFIPSILLFLLLFGVLIYVASEDWLAIPVCVVTPFLMFGLAIWHLFTTRRDELRIYQNGFTYRSGKNLQACLWKEIKFCHRREPNAREIAESETGIFPLGAVEKKNGEVIEFENDLDGTTEILKRFESPKTKRKSKMKISGRDLN